MWTCHKCGKPVYFAERKQSLGYDWHPECLRCEECGKRLNPGQHADHKGVPYCHIPCYSALFGPTLFGHGSRVESHKSFGKIEKRPSTPVDRSHLEAKLRIYNQFYEGRSHELKSRERNGKLILEGVLRIYWGVNIPIHLKEDDDQRAHVQVVRKRNSYREAIDNGPILSQTLPRQKTKSTEVFPELKNVFPETEALNGGGLNAENRLSNGDSEHDDACNGEDNAKEPTSEVTASSPMLNDHLNVDYNSAVNSAMDQSETKAYPGTLNSVQPMPRHNQVPTVQIRKMASSRSRTKLKRRCSINGHYYDRETSVFTPPFSSASNVWVSSMVNSPEVINMLLDKFRVEDNPDKFALFIVRDNGETRRVQDPECPLLVRVMLGPHEDVAKVFIMDKLKTDEISSEVAQFLNLSIAELNAFLVKYRQEEEREIKKIKTKYREMKYRLRLRMADLISKRQPEAPNSPTN